MSLLQDFTHAYVQALNKGDVARGMKKGGNGNWFPYSGGHCQISFGGTFAPMQVTADGLPENARPIASQQEFDAIAREMRDQHGIWLRPYGCSKQFQSGFILTPPLDCVEPLKLAHGTSDYKEGNCVLAVPASEKIQGFHCTDKRLGYINVLEWDGEWRHVQSFTVAGHRHPFRTDTVDENRGIRCSLKDGGIEVNDNGMRYMVPLVN